MTSEGDDAKTRSKESTITHIQEDNINAASNSTYTTRYGRKVNKPETYVARSVYYDAMHEDDYKIQDVMQDPIAFVATSDEDTMYYHQAMNQPDAKEFKAAAIKPIGR